jgi:hypothetical protein
VPSLRRGSLTVHVVVLVSAVAGVGEQHDGEEGMKLLQDAPPPPALVPAVKVRDAHGRVWEVAREDVTDRQTAYWDYQGGTIYGRALCAETPDGTLLLVPPWEEWKEGKVYDGVLSHPYGSLEWR